MSAFKTPAERFLRDLIAIPSITGYEGQMKDLLEFAFKEIGLEVCSQHVDSDRYNIIGKLGEGPIRLMLTTHMDVIPALDESKWQTPPFKAVKDNDRIYGRGSTDAKGSLAAMMEAVQRVKASGKKLNGSIAIAAVVEEETGTSLGSKKLIEEFKPESVIVGEPTGLDVAITHKGAIRPVITVHGKAAHGSSPRRGVNAISLMGKALNMLDSYGQRISKNVDPMLGRSSFEITMIHGGERINVIPERCNLYIDRRLVSSETIDGAFGDLKKLVNKISKRLRTNMEIELLCAYPPSKVDEREQIVKTALDVLSKNGLRRTPVGFPAGCDMWVFRSVGIPTIVFGPGSLKQAHVIGEYIDVKELGLAVDVYEGIAYSLLC
ncbi:acetylornithine deacetylase [Methanocella sp. CWC-04]|uniref:Acetylornithine deacetylase n=1 Tax=Methanooceanicella nereidis TaxID=2052831 RepID=A0AAP2W8J8_9EURY|nr:M20 family metallopeptidase [Methanocella sp. CWC-04]MCD1296264.1 acetylornithine deacetylase [Methanocella sp. CWC-04]